MKRRDFLKGFGTVCGAALVGQVGGCTGNIDVDTDVRNNNSAQKLRKTPPNIILVITDDQGYGDLSCHGNSVLKTPYLDSLYSKSVRFTQFQVSPTCAPTRSSLMSGRHEFKNGVTHTIYERERMSLDTTTLAEVLHEAGYATGIFGKWHLGDEDAYQPGGRGFDEVFIHGGGGIGQKYPDSCADAPDNKYFDPVIKHNDTFVKTKGFCTDVFFRQCLGWIDQRRRERVPFFAYLSTNAPHSPYIAPESYKKRFIDMGLDEKEVGFYGMIENIDDNMGLLMDKLRQWGLEDDTLLIFMTDNGTSAGWNAGMKGRKAFPNEGGTRVPAFFHWKATLPEGVDVDRLASHIDLFPTLTELGGAKVPAGNQLEGRSLVPLLKDSNSAWEDRYLFIHVGRWPRGANPDDYKYSKCAVRSERFRFVNNTELYDMVADPGETTNVTDRYPEVVKKMRAAYEAWWQETRPLMVNEDASYQGSPPFIKHYEQQKKTRGIAEWVAPDIM